MTEYELAIIIINYKTPDMVLDVLRSLQPELVASKMKAIIVDNHSQDGSAMKIAEWIRTQNVADKFELIASETNSGFSGGNNLGIKAIKAKHYLLLNSDTIVRPGTLNILLDAACSYANVGLLGPRLEWQDETPQESCFRFHSPISELLGAAKTGFITRIFKKFVVAQPVRQQPDFYDWTSFACVLIKQQVFEQIGLLDDGFFMYFEDVDFCYRAKQAGWQILNVPDAHVVHLRGGSSPLKKQAKLRKRLPRYFYESRTRFFYKCYGRLGLLSANILWSVGCSIAWIRSLISKNYRPDISERQWRDIWINFFDPNKPYIHPEHYD